MKLKWLAWLTTGSLVASVCAAELPELTLPDGVGVNIHFVTGHEADLDLIADAGFRFIWMDFGWAATETAKGRYDWSEVRGQRPEKVRWSKLIEMGFLITGVTFLTLLYPSVAFCSLPYGFRNGRNPTAEKHPLFRFGTVRIPSPEGEGVISWPALL